MTTRAWLLSCLLLGGACGGEGGGGVDGGGGTVDAGGGADAFVDPLLEARPYALVVPDDYSDDTPTPLVVLLHGYSANGAVQAVYFGLSAAVDRHDFLMATPDGTEDSMGNFFWNATDACCNFDNSSVDDVAYVTAIIEDVKRRFNVDGKRVYLVGHSNGGFMSNRMACDRADLIAGIFELAGAGWDDPAACAATEPVNVAHVHGDMDATIFYEGGAISGNAYPGAAQTVADWATRNGCGGGIVETGMLDMESALVGVDTRVEAYEQCPAGGAVELWTIVGGSHIPSFNLPEWPDAMIEWLYAHPKP